MSSGGFAPEYLVSDQPPADAPPLPPFGGEGGWLHPALGYVLERMTRLTVPRGLGLRPAATDTYVVAVTVLGLGVVAWLDWVGPSPLGLTAAAVFVCWRVFELFSVTSFEFFVGTYRWRENIPLGRIVTLKTVNLFEMIVVYGLAYYLMGSVEPRWFGPGPAGFNQPLPTASAAVYFSAITAATVGYGEFHPTHWSTRFLAVTESFFFVAVAINILGVLRARAPLTPGDHQANGTDPAGPRTNGVLTPAVGPLSA